MLLWDLADRAKPRRLGEPLTGHSDEVIAVAFAPDGQTLATAGGDGTVLLWDLADRAKPRRLGEPLTGHSDGVVSVAFAPDGQTLATASDDGTVLLWDLADRAKPRRLGEPLTGHSEQGVLGGVRSGRADPCHRRRRTVLLWDLGDLLHLRDNVLARACAIAGRGFNREEWNRYVPELDLPGLLRDLSRSRYRA